jgi:phosphoglycolate phosphatase
MKVILFDFDGVIVDTFSFCYRIMNSRDAISEDFYRAKFEGNINDAFKKPEQNPDAKPFDFYGQYNPELMSCQPNEEVVKVIKELARNHMLIIISSTISSSIEQFLEVHGLADVFKEILGNDVEKSKVKKINDVLQRYGIKSTETVFITDTLGDIKEANVCGVKSIAVTWGYHPSTTLEKGSPYRIIDHPNMIIETIQMMK